MFKVAAVKKTLAVVALAAVALLPVSAKTDTAVLHLTATVAPKATVTVAENGNVEFSLNTQAHSTFVEATAEGYTLNVVAC